MVERHSRGTPQVTNSKRQLLRGADLARWLLLGILLFGFALRLYHLGSESLWLDEMGQASVASGTLREALAGAKLHHGAAPLDYLLTWLVLQIASIDFLVRLPAAFFGTLTLALLYLLGRKLFDRPAGLLAALLLAIAPLHLRFSQEARFYALFTALVVASTLALLLACRRNTWRQWAIYGLLIALSLYSHYFTSLVMLFHGIIVVLVAAGLLPPGEQGTHWRLRVLLSFLLSSLVAAGSFLPWIFYAVLQETGTPFAEPPLLTLEFLGEIHTGLLVGPNYQSGPAGLFWLYGGLALLGAGVSLARKDTRTGGLLAVMLLILSPPLIVLGLHWRQYFFAVRQTLFMLPFYLLLVALGGLHLVRWLAARSWVGPCWRWLAGALALLLALSLWPASLDALNTPRQNWRDALAFVAANAAPGDAILSPRLPNHYFRYYAPDLHQRMENPTSLADFQATAEASPVTWTLVAAYIGDLGGQTAGWLSERDALWLDFGGEGTCYYWRPTASLADLLADSLHWTVPSSPQALEQLAFWYDNADMPEAAAGAALQAVALTDDREAASIYQRTRGNVWRKQGEPEQAVAAYRDAVVLWPDNVEALIRLGEQLLVLGQPEEAAAVLERAVKLADGNGAAYWSQRLLGDALAAQGEVEAASENYQAAASFQPDEPIIYFKLGNALAAWGDLAGAARAYERYLALDPAGPRAEEAQERLAGLSK